MTTKSNEKKGGYMRINNEIKFIKYMEGTEDKNYKKYIKKLLKLNWRHYKLYLVGGILEGWKTIDIDIAIIGKKDKYLIPLMEEARILGPFDVSYLKSYEDILNLKSNTRAKTYDRKNDISEPFKNGEWIDGLYWIKDLDFTANEKYKIKKHTKKPLLIN